MFDLTKIGWKRSGLLALFLTGGLVLMGSEGRPDDTKKAATKPATDDTKSETKKSDDKKDTKPAETPEPVVPPPSGGFPQTDAVNKQLAKFWAENSAKPSRRATDYEFCRRVYLDILGRIPSIWEVQDYVNDSDRTRKRAKLIHKLLTDPHYKSEYEDHWADLWTTLLLTRSGNKTYHEQLHVWLEEAFGKNKPWDQIVRELITATGENNDNGAVNFILAHVGDAQQQRDTEGMFDAVPITSRSTRLFLGIQIQCAQCHNHPFNPEWKQAHFWGVNAFFRQIEREGTPNMRNQRNMNMAAKLGLKDNSKYNTDGKVFFEDRQAVMHQTAARFLDGKKVNDGKFTSRREALAQFVVEHEQFSKAFVNRMWAHFFGRSLTQNTTVDDFGEHNQVTHPELLDGLANSFKEYKYNIKELISWICNSEAYNLSVEANPTNNKPEHDVYFSRMLLKNMTPEQLYESLRTALDQPAKPKSGSTAEIRKPAGVADNTQAARAKRRKDREAWLSKLTRNFGDDEGNEITYSGTVVQALLMMNGQELQAELTRAENNTIALAAKGNKSTNAILSQLTLAALGRPASQKEMQVLRNEKIMGSPQWFWEDVFWALLNSNEFILNH